MANRFSSEVVIVLTATEWDVEPAETTLRVALYGGLYADTLNPTGPHVHYQGRIKSDVVLEKKIGVVFWGEDSEIDFGYVDIAVEDQNPEIVDFINNVTIASVEIYRVNLNDYTSDQLSIVAIARSSDIGFVDESTVRVRMESVLQGGFDAPINDLYYDSTYLPLEGKPYPIAWAKISDPEQLLPVVFVDPITLRYDVTDLEIDSFDSDVYDRGIALSEGVTPGFDATAHGFTLNQNPDGKLTAGKITLVDPVDSGTFTGLYRFMRLAMTRAGLWSNANEEELITVMGAIAKGTVFPEFYSMEVVSLEDFMNEVFAGVACWYYVDEFSEIHFGRLVSPDLQTPAFSFTDTNVIGDIDFDDDKAPGLVNRLSYAENAGKYEQDELAGAVTNADRSLMTNERYTVSTTETVIPFYNKATSRDPVKLNMSHTDSEIVGAPWTCDSNTFTIDSDVHTADGYGAGVDLTATQIALLELNRWWSQLYPKRRRFYSCTVPLNDDQFESGVPQLGQYFSLQSETFDLLETAKVLTIRGLVFNFSDNLLTITGWG